MLFNSIDFGIFLPIVFFLYWFVFQKNIRHQNLLLVFSSYLFYGWWDWRFLFLIFFSSITDYLIGKKIQSEKNENIRKKLLFTSLFVNLGILGFFKYYNFFLENFINTFSFFGHEFEVNSLNIILPVGISFYTFQTLSYTIDVYRNNLRATTDFISFSAFVSFFPQLVAGPIERATNLLPQFETKRNFNYDSAVNGLRQILWGFFKKVVIADGCAEYANLIFENSADETGITLIIGAVLFSFQIYGDFSGYSDIAIGTSKLFGFNLMQNFNFPYFSRNIGEFWRRWHISLSTWFRDYLYIPLGGSRVNTIKKVRNTFVIFIVSGFWHGANWTFIIWGLLNAIYFMPLLLTNKNRMFLNPISKDKFFPNVKECFSIFSTFMLTVLAWVFFRANSVSHAFEYLFNIFKKPFYNLPEIQSKFSFLCLIALIFFFLIIEWVGRHDKFAISTLGLKMNRAFRWGVYFILIFLIFVFSGKEQEFIYFQF